MGNTELNLFRLKQNWNSSTKKKKPGKRFPSFLFSSSTGCSKLHHHWQCSPPALCRSAKRQRGDLCHLLLSFLPRFFTLPAGISPLPPITPQTEVPSSHCLLQLNIKPSPWEGSLELHFDDPSPWVPPSSGCSTILWFWAIMGEATERGDAAAHSSRQPAKQGKCHMDTAVPRGSCPSTE